MEREDLAGRGGGAVGRGVGAAGDEREEQKAGRQKEEHEAAHGATRYRIASTIILICIMLPYVCFVK